MNPQPNLLQRLAPTIGGVLGGIGGEIIDPLGGGIAGAAAGSALGKGIENASTHQNLTSGLGGAALEGGLGQGAGSLLGGALGIGGGLLSKFGGEQVAKEAGAKAMAETTSNLANEFGGITPKLKQDLNFGNSLDLADQIGIPKTAQGFSLARNVGTGENGYLNGVLDSIVRDKGPVDLSSFGKTVDSAIGNEPTLGSLEPQVTANRLSRVNSTANNTRQQLEQLLQGVGYKSGGSLDSKADPDAALELMRTIRGEANKYAGSETGTEGAAQFRVYNNIYKELKDSIYNRPEVNQAIKEYISSPEEIQSLTNMAGGNQQLAKFLSDTMANAGKASDITKVESQLVDMGDLGDKALDFNKNVVGTQQQAKEAQAALEGTTPDIPLSKGAVMGKVLKTGANMSGNVANKAGDLLQRMSLFTGDKSGDVLSKVLPAAGAGLASSASGIQGQGTMQPTANMIPGQQIPGAPQSGGLPVSNAYNTMLGMMTMDPYLASSLASPVQNLAPLAQKANAAQALLPQVEQGSQGIAGQGLAGGLTSNLLGKLGLGPAASYQNEANSLQQLLASLGIPLSAPTTTTAPQGVPMQFNALNSILSGVPAQ